jgi:hypothetical protein
VFWFSGNLKAPVSHDRHNRPSTLILRLSISINKPLCFKRHRVRRTVSRNLLRPNLTLTLLASTQYGTERDSLYFLSSLFFVWLSYLSSQALGSLVSFSFHLLRYLRALRDVNVIGNVLTASFDVFSIRFSDLWMDSGIDPHAGGGNIIERMRIHHLAYCFPKQCFYVAGATLVR